MLAKAQIIAGGGGGVGDHANIAARSNACMLCPGEAGQQQAPQPFVIDRPLLQAVLHKVLALI